MLLRVEKSICFHLFSKYGLGYKTARMEICLNLIFILMLIFIFELEDMFFFCSILENFMLQVIFIFIFLTIKISLKNRRK